MNDANLIEAAQIGRELAELVLAFLDKIYPEDVFTGESGDEGALMVVGLRAKAHEFQRIDREAT